MRISNQAVFWSSVAMIWLGVGYMFVPAARVTSGWQWAIQASFVFDLVFIALVWAYGMKMETRRSSTISIVIPLFALFNLYDKIPPNNMSLSQALVSTGLMLGICAVGLIFFYGVSFKKRQPESSASEI